MKFVVSTKSGKAYSAANDDALFGGKKIGNTVKLDEIGLTGFEATITGGSDKQGFPMNNSVASGARKKIFTTGGVGVKTERKGERRKEFREDAREQKEWAKQRNALNHSMKKSISDMSTAEYLEMRRKKSLRNALIIAFVIFLITMWITNSIVMMRI